MPAWRRSTCRSMPPRSTRRASTRRRDRWPIGATRSTRWAAIPNGCRSAKTCGSTCAGANVAWTCGSHPKPIVHWRLRGDVASTWRQYFRYARGDAQAGMHPERHALRFATYGGLALAISSRRTLPKLLAAAGAVTYARTPVRRAWRRLDAPGRARARGRGRAGAHGVHRRREDGRLRRGARRSHPARRPNRQLAFASVTEGVQVQDRDLPTS